MPTKLCARPCCGHDHMNACCVCPCPAYRTQEQQEAWENASASVRSGVWSEKSLVRLLELYS